MNPLIREATGDLGYGLGCFRAVYRDANQFGAGCGKRGRLIRSGDGVRSVRVRHRLHCDWGIAANKHRFYFYANRLPAPINRHLMETSHFRLKL
jgi:hypothetical protein